MLLRLTAGDGSPVLIGWWTLCEVRIGQGGRGAALFTNRTTGGTGTFVKESPEEIAALLEETLSVWFSDMTNAMERNVQGFGQTRDDPPSKGRSVTRREPGE